MKNQTIPSSEITPKNVYLSRRQFIKAAGVIAGSLTLAACGITPDSEITSIMPTASMPSTPPVEGQDIPNSFDEITNYNNYYEFTTTKRCCQPGKEFQDIPLGRGSVRVGE